MQGNKWPQMWSRCHFLLLVAFAISFKGNDKSVPVKGLPSDGSVVALPQFVGKHLWSDLLLPDYPPLSLTSSCSDWVGRTLLSVMQKPGHRPIGFAILHNQPAHSQSQKKAKTFQIARFFRQQIPDKSRKSQHFLFCDKCALNLTTEQR